MALTGCRTCQIQAQATHHAVHAGLRRRICRNAVVRDEGCCRRGCQDDPATIGTQVRNGRLRCVEDTGEVHPDDVLPVGIGQVLELDLLTAGDGRNTASGDDTRVGPGDVELPERGDRCLDGIDHLLLHPHVRSDRDRGAALLLDQFDRPLGALRVDIDDATLAPSAANSCDASRPRPEPAPVIRRLCLRVSWKSPRFRDLKCGGCRFPTTFLAPAGRTAESLDVPAAVQRM